MMIQNKVRSNFCKDLCPDFSGGLVGRVSFLFHNSQQLLPALEGISV